MIGETAFVSSVYRDTPLTNSENSPVVNLTDYMGQSFMRPDSRGAGLHDPIMKLPFFQRLRSKEITAQELLQHFVNNAAIFHLIETINKIEGVAGQIIGDIYRKENIEKDIRFFMNKFRLARPKITEETQGYLEFIKKIHSEDPNLLLPVIYTQYVGLLSGRFVCHHTAEWLKTNLDIWWDILPLDANGISCWNFENLKTPQDLAARKEKFLADINRIGMPLQKTDRLKEIARKSFEYSFNCIQSASPKALANRRVLPLLKESIRNYTLLLTTIAIVGLLFLVKLS